MLKIRQMQKKDIPGILLINEQYPAMHLTEKDLSSFSAIHGSVCLVAEENSKIVGFLLLLFSQHAASILDVETDMEHIGGQVTTSLLEAARRVAMQNGITAFYKTKAFHTHVI